MSLTQLIQDLKRKCAEPLPGFEAHLRMAPYRKMPDERVLELQRATYRQAAVTVLLYPEGESCCFSLIQRPDYEGVHGGQISFPGGKLEEQETFLEAALREMEEEIGIERHAVDVIGSLTEVFIPPSKMRVIPYLCYLPKTPVFKVDTTEVVEVFSINVNELLSPYTIKTTRVVVGKGTAHASELEVPYFDLNNKVVWGATAVILSELKELLERD
jgi:8-oxo-dGTP pyrophosphatase MutT (NUDIX family)